MKPRFNSRLLRSLSAIVLALAAPSAFSATETFNTAGTFNWVCPGGVSSVQVECWGGGGAGGAGRKDTTAGTNTSQNGGGGGGGAYAKKVAVPVTPGTTYTITIPAAAVSGSAGTTTSGAGRVNGSNVTFVGNSGVTVTAAGGQGGANAYTTSNATISVSGATGGTTGASVGDVGGLFAGGAGSASNTGATNVSGSGGGGAGNANPGGAGVITASTTTAGAGGLVGGGAGGAGRAGGNTNPGPGGNGTTPGGGGGGGHNQGISTEFGGTGGLGQIKITYTDPPATVKADNSDNLNLTSSWTAHVPHALIAEWTSTVAAANTTSLGANLTFDGIKISSPGGLVTINPGIPSSNTLTLGDAAIDLDLSAATQDLTVNCNLALGAANVWDVAATKALTLGGAITGAQSVTKQGLGTATLSGLNASAASNYSGTTILSAGTLALTTTNPSLNGGLTFGSTLGNTNTGTLDLSGASATFAGAVTVQTNSSTANTITVGSGKTLTFSGTALNIGTATSSHVTKLAIAGATSGVGSLVFNNSAAVISVGVGSAADLATATDNTLDLTTLGSVSMGTIPAPITTLNVGFGRTAKATLLLSNTANVITATTLNLGDSDGGNPGPGQLTLGTGTNVLNLDTINIGHSKATATLSFASQTAGSPGTVTIKNKAGANGLTDLIVGSQTGTNTGTGLTGNLDLRGHISTVNVGVVTMGNTNQTSTGNANGILRFDEGTFDATSLNLGLKSSSGTGSNTANAVNIGGGTFAVSGAVAMSAHTGTGATGNVTSKLNITDGTVNLGSTVSVANKNGSGGGVAAGEINVSGGALNVTGLITLGTQATAGTATALLNVTGGTVTSTAGILGGAGTTTSTINLNGASAILDLTGDNITNADTITFTNGTLKDLGVVNTGMTLAGSGSRVFEQTTGTGTIQGAITGSGIGLTKQGAGILALGGVNSYSGGTSVTAGTLSLTGSLTGGGAVSTSGSGILTQSAAGAISGASTFTQGSSGTSVLSGDNSYTGATLVSAGTLALSGSGDINSSSGITVNGSGAKLLQNSTTDSTPGITLSQGTLTGSGTVGAVGVANSTSAIISNNDGMAGASLTTGALTFNGAATVSTYSASTSAPIAATGLTTSGNVVTINPTAASWPAGTYDLISYTGTYFTVGNPGDFSLGTVTGASPRQTKTFGNSGTAITLAIGADDTPYWAGDGDDKWNLASTSNWKLVSDNSYTTFLASDNVLFNDSATGAGPIAVDIDAANVAPSSTTFNNTTKNYVLSGAFGISTGSLTKNGTGSVTITTANTYTGATNINAGTITLSGSGTLGTGSALTLGGGKLDLGTLSRTVGAVSVTAPAASGDTILNGSLAGTSYAASNTTGDAIISANLLVNGGAGFTKTDAGTVTLSGTNTYTGATAINGGTLTLSGIIGSGGGTAVSIANAGTVFNATNTNGLTGTSSLTVGANTTAVLSAANNFSGATSVTGTLQLGHATSLGTSTMTLASGATLQLRNDANTTFTAPIATPGAGVGVTYNFDVNQATGAGTGRTMTLGNMTFGSASTNTINVTGGNGYALALGTLLSPSGSGGPWSFTINSTSAAVTIAKFSAGSFGNALALQGGNNITLSNFEQGSNGTNSLTVSGSGTVATLGTTTQTNGRAGGNTSYTLNSGTLNLTTTTSLANVRSTGTANAATFAINGGTLNNTSGAALALAANSGVTAGSPNITIGGDFAFTGSNDLNLGLGTVSLGTTAGATRTITANASNLTLGGIISDGTTAKKIIKDGAGILTLSGANAYTGGTDLNSGTLAVTSTGSLANGGISVTNAGSTLAVTPLAAGTVNFGNSGTAGAGANLNLGSGTIFSMVNAAAGGTTNLVQEGTFATDALTLNNATLNFELSGATADKLAVTGALATASVSGTNTINLTPLAALTSGTYDLITTVNPAGGLSTGGTFAFASGLTTGVGSFGGINYLLTLNNSANKESVTVVAPPSAMTWTGQTLGTGTTDANWNTGASTNWAVGATPIGYANGNAVAFQDTNTVTAGNVAAPSLAVTVQAGGVNPGSTTFNNSAVDYTVGGGAITGTGGVTKTGTGTVTLSGANTYTGNTTVTGGILNISGTLTGNSTSSTLAYGTAAGNTVVNVSNNMTLFRTTGANIAGSVAVYNQTAGTVNVAGQANNDLNNVANIGYGYFNLTGGTYKIPTRFNVASNNDSAVGVAYVGGAGTLDLSGGDWSIIAYGGAGTLTAGPGGTINRTGNTNNFGIMLNKTGAYGVLNVAGGDVINPATAGPIRFGNAGISNTTGFVNLAAGTLTVGANTSLSIATGTGNNGYFNFVGGTLKAAGTITQFVPTNTPTTTFTSTVFGAVTNNNNANTAFNTQIGTASNFVGGLVVNTDGFPVTFRTPLLAGGGFGVTQTNIGDVSALGGNSGYIGAPSVQFSAPSGVGIPATGYAVINAGTGTVTGIVITNPGVYAASETPTITLTGGGGSIAPFATSALATANTSGGLTKQGANTLTLTDTNTYTGATTISGGTLQLGNGTATGSLSTNSAISVGTGAIFAINQSDTVAQGGDISTSPITGLGGFTQAGTGTTVLNLANGFSGATAVNAGTLQLAFSGGVTSDILNASSALTMGGGTLKLTGIGTQIVAGLTTTPGTTSSITLAANQTLTLGALTSAGAGSWLNFNTVAGGANATTTTVGTSIITLTGQTAGIAINPGFTVTDAGGYGLATVNISNQVVRLTTGYTLLPASGALFPNDYLVDNNTGGGGTGSGGNALVVTASQAANSITVDTTTASGILTMDPGFVLSNNTWNFGGAGTNTYQITGNTSGAGLTSVASNDAININNFNTGLVTFASPLLANGTNNVILAGTGTTVFSGTNTYTGSTTISAGQLTIDDGSIALSSNIVNNAALEYKLNATPRTYANVISGSGTLIKSGTNTLTLTGANTYSGGTTITGTGTLLATKNAAVTNAIGSGSVNVGTGSTLVLDITKTTNITDTVANTFIGSGLLKLQFAASTTNARNTSLSDVTGFGGTIQLSSLGTTGDKWNANNVGTVAGSLIVDAGSTIIVQGGPASFTGGITLNGAGNSEGRGAIRMGATSLGGNISLASSSTVSMESAAAALLTGNITSGAAGTQTLTLGATGSTGGTLSGIIGGGTGAIDLATAVGGNYTLTNANTYTGTTTIAASTTLQLGNGTSGNDGTINNTSGVTNNGTLAFNRFGTDTWANAITGTGAVSKLGAGTQTLSGLNALAANNYSGTTTIGEGTLAFTTTNPTLTGGLRFGSANTTTTAGILDLTSASATFNGTLLVNTNSATANEIIIGAAQTLAINNNVQIGAAPPAVTGTVTRLNMTGGGTFNVSTAAAGTFNFGANADTSLSQDITLDLTALSATTINTTPTGTIRVNSGSGTNTTGTKATMLLPTPAVADTVATATLTGGTIGVGAGSAFNSLAGQINTLQLGTGLTALNADNINVGTGSRDLGQIIFAGAGGDLIIRAADGSSRATAFNVGTGGATTATGEASTNNLVDFSGHDANILVTSLNVGNQGRQGIGVTSEFKFGAGTGSIPSTLDATNVNIGFRTAVTASVTTVLTNRVILSGGTVTFGNGGATGAGVDIGSSAYSGAGAASTIGELNISGGTVTIHNGTGGFAVRIGTNTSANGGTVTASMNLTGGTVTLTGDIRKGTATGSVTSTLALNGASAILDMGGNDITSLTGITYTDGTLKNLGIVNTGMTLAGAGSRVFDQDLGVSGDIQGEIAGMGIGLTKEGDGKLTLSGTNTYDGATLVSKGTLLLTGSIAGTINVATTATLAGNGTVAGAATIATTGILSPGDSSVNTLNFGSTLDMQAGSNYEVSITSATTNDKVIAATGAVTANGTIKVTLSGYTPVAGNTFDLADSTSGAIGGTPTFDFTAATLTAGLAWDTTTFATDGTIKVINSDPFTAWADGGAFGDDANGDGVSNGLAWLLGAADKDANALGLLPKIIEDNGNLVLEFTCLKEAGRGDAVLNVQHSSDLGILDAWEDAEVPDADSTVNDVTFDNEANVDPDLIDVTATIPASKAAGGKLFGRIEATKP